MIFIIDFIIEILSKMPASFYIKYFLLIIITSIFFALMEIQIEGKCGWARCLPTWRKMFCFAKFIPGGDKEITGYHLYSCFFRLSLLHIAFLFLEWTLGLQLLILSFYFLFNRMADFFWFVFNPDYGIKKFKKRYIPWHTCWIGPMPIQYYFSIIFWFILFIFGLWLS